jgi:Phosphate transport (Pho88)/Myc amino-terminal region
MLFAIGTTSFAFVAYLAILQAFVLYVRIQAKLANDRTVITLTNPLSSVLQSPLLGGGNGEGGAGGAAAGMVKNLASSFLSSTSTVVEYDLKQANSMQSGLIFNMALNWFLHFKMQQVQPLFIQSATGLLNMLYSPLFQVYVLGRNLERPFPNPNLKKPPASEANEDAESASETPEAVASSPTGQSAIEAGKDNDEDEEEEEQDDEEVDVGEVEESDDDNDEESPSAPASGDVKGASAGVSIVDRKDVKVGDDDESGDDSTSDGSSDEE